MKKTPLHNSVRQKYSAPEAAVYDMGLQRVIAESAGDLESNTPDSWTEGEVDWLDK